MTVGLTVLIMITQLFAGDVHAAGMEMSASNGEADFGSRTLQLEVAPSGTHARQVAFDVIQLANPAQSGASTDLNVVFRNSGQIGSTAVFVGEVQRDGTLVGALQSVGRVVDSGASEDLDAFVDTKQPGGYLVTGKINFEGRETDSKSVTFTVTGNSPPETPTEVVDGPAPDAQDNSGQTASASEDASSTGEASSSDAPALESRGDRLQRRGGSGGSNSGMIVTALIVVTAFSVLGGAGWMVKKRLPL